MDVFDIKDRQSLENWLIEQNRKEVSVAIAHRVAMRVGPLVWSQLKPAGAGATRTALPQLRAVLTSGIAAVLQNEEISAAVASAAKPTDHSGGGGGAIASAIYAAGPSPTSDDPADAIAAYDAAGSVVAAVEAAPASSTKIWQSVRSDCAFADSLDAMLAAPLWWGTQNPLDSIWLHVRMSWSAAPDDWDGWIRWYEQALTGGALNWPLLKDIALIDNEIWNEGPSAVAAAIREIEAAHQALDAVIDQTPNAEEIVLDATTRKLTAIPIAPIDGDLREHIRRSIEKAVRRFRRDCQRSDGSNSAALMLDCADADLEDLAEDLAENQHMDLALHDDIDRCLGALRRKFAEQGIEDDSTAQNLFGILERCTIDVIASNDEVRVVVEKRADEFYRRIKLEQLLEFNQWCADMAADSDPWLARRMLADAALADDENADPDLRRRSRYNTVSRVSRGARAMKYSRFRDGEQIVETPKRKSSDRLWWSTALAPSGATLLGWILTS